jgi:hypothetical protein
MRPSRGERDDAPTLEEVIANGLGWETAIRGGYHVIKVRQAKAGDHDYVFLLDRREHEQWLAHRPGSSRRPLPRGVAYVDAFGPVKVGRHRNDLTPLDPRG